jgi:serine/threonine protein kinase
MGKLVLNRKWVLERVMPGADPGSGGIVWLAHPRGKPRARYVVKTVASELADKRTRRYIQQLGVRHEQRAAKVTSDHIGQIVDHGDDQGFFYLVYPLYQPGSLWAYCSWKGEWPLDWCVQVIDDVLSGLIDAFAFNLVHLDVKPNNVVLDGERVRVIDWGLSRVWNASQPSTWVANGTPFFACPEQFINPQQGFDTPLADLYGVGATFYWLLTGEGPLRREAREAGEGSDPLAYGKLLVAGRRPQLVHDLVPGIPRQLGNLIDRWLSLEPRERMPRETRPEGSLRVARNQLRELRSGLPEMNVGRVTARRHKRRHWK